MFNNNAISKYGATKIADTPLYEEPHTIEEIFSVKSIDKSGVFELNNDKYSKVFTLTDINFDGVTEDEQEDIIINFAGILKSMSSYRFSYTIANEFEDKDEYDKKTIIKEQNDGYDELRKSYSDIIANKVFAHRKGLIRTIYLTITIDAKNMQEANKTFDNIEFEINKSFNNISVSGMNGSKVVALDINKRMQQWYNFTHLYDNDHYKFDYNKELSSGRDFVNIVTPYKIDLYNKYFVLNNIAYGKVIGIEKYPNEIGTEIIEALTDLKCISYVTVNCEPIEKEVLHKELIKKQNLVSMRVSREKQELRKQNDFLSEISKSTQALQDSLTNLADDLRSKDEKYFNTSIFVMYLTDSEEKLKEIDTAIDKIKNQYSLNFSTLFNRQREGINSALPFGIQEIKRCCNFSSISLAEFIPFKAQDFNDENGMYFGLNRLSQNPIFINRKIHKNHNEIVTGESGSGKSAGVKFEMGLAKLMNPDDRQIVIDPQNEFAKYAKAYGGTIIRFEPGKNLFINPMDVDFENVNYAGLQEIIQQKTDFVVTILASYLQRTIDKTELGIIDKAINKVYSENYAKRNRLNGIKTNVSDIAVPKYMKTEDFTGSKATDLSNDEQIKRYSPLLQDVYEELTHMGLPEADSLARAMDVFINGSLNWFNHRTNIDLSNPLIVFAFGDDLKELRITVETVCLEITKEQIHKNFKRGFWTRVYIDEMHELFEHEQIMNRVVRLWREERKNHGMLTGITQNLSEFVNNKASQTGKEALSKIFANTEFFVLASQSEVDIAVIKEYLPTINPVLLNYVRNAAPGTGIYKIGPICVPYDNIINKSDKIYSIIETSSDKR